MHIIRYDSPLVEELRKEMAAEINSQVQSDNPITERGRLEKME